MQSVNWMLLVAVTGLPGKWNANQQPLNNFEIDTCLTQHILFNAPQSPERIMPWPWRVLLAIVCKR